VRSTQQCGRTGWWVGESVQTANKDEQRVTLGCVFGATRPSDYRSWEVFRPPPLCGGRRACRGSRAVKLHHFQHARSCGWLFLQRSSSTESPPAHLPAALSSSTTRLDAPMAPYPHHLLVRPGDRGSAPFVVHRWNMSNQNIDKTIKRFQEIF
jgi:hypothetical protein